MRKRETQEVLRILKRLEYELDERKAELSVLRETIERLEEQNAQLFDRLMSRNFEEHQIFKDRKDESEGYIGDLDPRRDEDLTGEVVNLGEDPNAT